jgi:hypothetical protein
VFQSDRALEHLAIESLNEHDPEVANNAAVYLGNFSSAAGRALVGSLRAGSGAVEIRNFGPRGGAALEGRPVQTVGLYFQIPFYFNSSTIALSLPFTSSSECSRSALLNRIMPNLSSTIVLSPFGLVDFIEPDSLKTITTSLS